MLTQYGISSVAVSSDLLQGETGDLLPVPGLMNSPDHEISLRSHPPAYMIGQGIGQMLGTCDEYGRPTELSYPLDRFVNYIYTKYRSVVAISSNILNKIPRKTKWPLSQHSVEEMTISEHALATLDREAVDSEKKITEYIDSVLMEMRPHFIKFRLKIQKAINESIINGKPLLILIGEHHYSLNSTLMEALILNMLSSFNDFEFQNIYTESFEKNIYGAPEGKPYPYLVIEQMAQLLGKTKIPIDLATCEIFEPSPEACGHIDYHELMSGGTISLKNVTSASGMQKRNQVMTYVMNTLKQKGNAVAIVGQDHLFGIMTETTLNEHYHIVPITLEPNAQFLNHTYRDIHENFECEMKYRLSCFHYLKSNEVLQLTSELGLEESNQYSYASELIIEKTKKTALRLTTDEEYSLTALRVN